MPLALLPFASSGGDHVAKPITFGTITNITNRFHWLYCEKSHYEHSQRWSMWPRFKIYQDDPTDTRFCWKANLEGKLTAVVVHSLWEDMSPREICGEKPTTAVHEAEHVLDGLTVENPLWGDRTDPPIRQSGRHHWPEQYFECCTTSSFGLHALRGHLEGAELKVEV